MNLSGVDKLKAKLGGIKSRIANPEPGLKRAAMVVLKAAKEHIKSGGPGWAPNQTGTPLLFQSGRLINSLQLGADGNDTELRGNTIYTGTNVPYAKFLQEGTGVFGPSGTPIRPKNGRALAFEVNGKMVFAKSVKGSPARPFLYIDDHVAQVVNQVYKRYIMGASDADLW